MLDGWIKLGQFLADKFGLPGSLAICLAAGLFWLLREERTAHSLTRDKIDAINEKRIEQTMTTVKIVDDLKTSLQAVSAILDKSK